MNQEIQRKQIGNSLKAITEVFAGCNASYRVLGSVLIVAHTNKVFRRINDVDILLDARVRDCVIEKLKTNGFQLEKKTKAGISWFEAEKEQFLGLTFFLSGTFNKNYFSWRFMRFCELRIREDHLRPT